MNSLPLTNRATLGIVTGLLGGSFFGVITPISTFAYAAGVGPMTVSMSRFGIGMVVMGLVLRLSGNSLHVPKAQCVPLLLMCLGVFGVTVCYQSAVAYIPVSLAAIIFYTHPVIVSVLDPLLLRRMPNPLQVGLSLLAFAGIAIALGPNLEGLDWRGLVFAGLASLSLTTTLINGRKVMPQVNSLSVVFYVNLLPCILLSGYFLFIEAPSWPQELVGTVSFFTVGFFYLLATFCQIMTLSLLTPSRTAMLFNTEPVVTIFVAVLVIGETLSLSQVTGSLCVLTAVTITCLRPPPART